MDTLGILFCVALNLPTLSEAREFCSTGGYWCDTGHCCNGECCTYYYELWWFWLVWFLIVFVIGFCVWQRKRFHPWRGNINHRTCSIQDFLRGFNFNDITPVPPCKLPAYSEIGDTVGYDTPPPPYTYYYIQAATSGFGSSSTCQELTSGRPCLSPLTLTQTEVAIETNGGAREGRIEPPDSAEAPPSYVQIMESTRERDIRAAAAAAALAQTLTPSLSPAATPTSTPLITTPAMTPRLTSPRSTPRPTPNATPRSTPCATPVMTPSVSRSPKLFAPQGSPMHLSPTGTPIRQCNEQSGNNSRRGSAATPIPITPLPSGNASSTADRGTPTTIVDLEINDKGSLNFVTRLT